jgi:hypothetical protein
MRKASLARGDGFRHGRTTKEGEANAHELEDD